MLKRLGRFFTPDRSASIWLRIMPYAALIFAGLVVFIVAGAGWEYTNSSVFCGTACHTMPPEYTAYLISPHANVNCVECHIGRATIATQFTRKAQDISHVIRYAGIVDYEVPIYAKKLRPASQVCERCHNPEKFSSNSLEVIKHYDAAQNNKLEQIVLSFKVGGGTYRQGRGKGIHWHIENKVEYIATDDPRLEQVIPWVQVTYADSGRVEQYVDVQADLSPNFVEQNKARIKVVDCMTCHNRESHKFKTPDEALDDAMERGVISAEVPYFKQNAIAVMERQYPSMDQARNAIKGLINYYKANWHDFYAANGDLVDKSVNNLITVYEDMVFPTMDVSWTTHPDNLGHKDWPGCFRCHDGKHLNEKKETIRIECNLCHSLPIKTPEDGSTPMMALTDAYEPPSHTGSNWIAQHRYAFDSTCKGCHDVANPGGSNDTSFCSNSLCHATDWKFAGLDASNIVSMTNVLAASLPTYPEVPLTWDDLVGPILQARCVPCHGGTAGLYLDTYEGVLAGGNLGPAIVPGNADASLLVQLQLQKHPNSLAPRELQWIILWLNAGAPKSKS